MVTISSICAEVILRPSTISVSTPIEEATFVAVLPPPCTRIFAPGNEQNSPSSSFREEGSSTTAPPTFTTVTFMEDYSDSSILFITTWAETTLFAASGITMLVGASMTSSDTIMFLLTGRQCMKKASSVTAI